MPSLDLAALADLTTELTALSARAANAIQRVKEQSRGGISVRIKADSSPVTQADDAAEEIIRDGLARLHPAWPVISEEQKEHVTPSGNTPHFLVDPLDGTREFIAGQDEYTVNIGLVAGGAPILGVIAAPALGLIWRGIVDRGAERQEFAGNKISPPKLVRARVPLAGELRVMISRSHLDTRTLAYLDSLPHAHRMACGSSIKFCRLAEGAADHYPRLAPTRDWDVAAGHAILVAAGGTVIDPDGAPIVYGTPELRIPGFLAWGASARTEGALNGSHSIVKG